MAIYQPELKYSLDALEPFLSQKTLNFHFNKHLQAYINTANTLTKFSFGSSSYLLPLLIFSSF